jgi:hypothetical protein
MLDMINELKLVSASDEAIWSIVKWFAHYDVDLIKRGLDLWGVTKFGALAWFARWTKRWWIIIEEASKVWKLVLKMLKFL